MNLLNPRRANDQRHPKEAGMNLDTVTTARMLREAAGSLTITRWMEPRRTDLFKKLMSIYSLWKLRGRRIRFSHNDMRIPKSTGRTITFRRYEGLK